jgi:hypothetical protein
MFDQHGPELIIETVIACGVITWRFMQISHPDSRERRST